MSSKPSKATCSQSAANHATSSRWLAVCLALATIVVNGGAQATSFQPTRCVRDTLRAPVQTVASADSVAPGIKYQCIYAKEGPWAIHVISIDLARYDIEGVRADDARLGREKVSDMARRLLERGESVLVALNADFFNLRTGEITNNTVIRGDWVKGVVVSDAPHEEVDNARTQFAMDSVGRPLIGRFELHGEVRAGGQTERLLGINNRPARVRGVVLYTSWFGARTPSDSGVVELVLARLPNGMYRPGGSLTTGGDVAIPKDGVVLSATGQAADFVRQLQGDTATIRITSQLGTHPVAPRTVVGGWGRLVVDGKSVAQLADSLEGTAASFSAARHPRSAIGVSRDSTTLWFVVVDGRRPWSVGMSLTELADRLLALGAYQAMNLDGGGSSTLWVRGTLVNFPSDSAGERAVGNAIIVRKRN